MRKGQDHGLHTVRVCVGRANNDIVCSRRGVLFVSLL